MNPTKDLKDISVNELNSLASTMELLKSSNPNAKKVLSAIKKELKRRAK